MYHFIEFFAAFIIIQDESAFNLLFLNGRAFFQKNFQLK
ncbi:hypothetical protein B4098_2779 [Heyndrickxia coagulans]|uniref:Uncharacterized protein n=1 Tax=Heyndrickxia coagulans TaxID=1398 RepID=A0A150K4B4_HEYCO|nr:hypothetical protein B4098_2779 [Heyndrickxia coagulans]